jgi:hypothetical protein
MSLTTLKAVYCFLRDYLRAGSLIAKFGVISVPGNVDSNSRLGMFYSRAHSPIAPFCQHSRLQCPKMRAWILERLKNANCSGNAKSHMVTQLLGFSGGDEL